MQNRGKFISFFYLFSISAGSRLPLVFCHGEDAVSLLNLYSHIAYTRQNFAFHVVAHADVQAVAFVVVPVADMKHVLVIAYSVAVLQLWRQLAVGFHPAAVHIPAYRRKPQHGALVACRH